MKTYLWLVVVTDRFISNICFKKNLWNFFRMQLFWNIGGNFLFKKVKCKICNHYPKAYCAPNQIMHIDDKEITKTSIS